jgi:hypothetical protein
MTQPFGIGWATVDLERARRELGPRLVDGTDFAVAPDSELLGARCRVGELRQPADARWLVLLEPATEGRLAGTLARHGEGFWATWETDTAIADADADADAEDALQAERPRVSAERPGPFGPERLRLGGPSDGPHRLLLTTATIGP